MTDSVPDHEMATRDLVPDTLVTRDLIPDTLVTRDLIPDTLDLTLIKDSMHMSNSLTSQIPVTNCDLTSCRVIVMIVFQVLTRSCRK